MASVKDTNAKKGNPMKLIHKTLATVTLILLSGNVLAGQYINTYGNLEERLATRTIRTDIVASEQEAYKQGLNKLQQLKNSSPKELEQVLQLNIFNSGGVHLNDDSYITVQEFMNGAGQLRYRGELNVSYHYAERRDD